MHSNVFSLREWWSQNTQRANKSERGSEFKVRYIGWDHKTRYLKLVKFDDKTDSVIGKLDNGEEISYPAEGRFWVEYDEGMENEARAI